LVKPAYQDWFDAIERLILDKQLRQKYGRAAYDMVQAKYGIKETAQQWVNFYKERVKCR